VLKDGIFFVSEYVMSDKEISRTSSDRLEKALSAVLGHARITSNLSQVLAYAVQKSTISYQEIKEIIKDDPEDVLLLTDEWRLLLAVSTTKSSSWEDRLLALKDGELYEIPNIIRYLLHNGLHTGKWEPEKAISTFFKELGDPDYKQIPGLVRGISEKAIDHRITRENRTHGSEGGEGETLPDPYQKNGKNDFLRNHQKMVAEKTIEALELLRE